MPYASVTERKRPGKVTIAPDDRLLVGRHQAAEMLSISQRAIDWLIANKTVECPSDRRSRSDSRE